MDYTALMKNECNMISRVGIIGATKGYGYTLLAQIPEVKKHASPLYLFQTYR